MPKSKYGESVAENDKFISTFIGSGIYNIRGAMRIVWQSCNYTNIWNIDKTNSFALIQPLGLIMNLQYFSGPLILGETG